MVAPCPWALHVCTAQSSFKSHKQGRVGLAEGRGQSWVQTVANQGPSGLPRTAVAVQQGQRLHAPARNAAYCFL